MCYMQTCTSSLHHHNAWGLSKGFHISDTSITHVYPFHHKSRFLKERQTRIPLWNTSRSTTGRRHQITASQQYFRRVSGCAESSRLEDLAECRKDSWRQTHRLDLVLEYITVHRFPNYAITKALKLSFEIRFLYHCSQDALSSQQDRCTRFCRPHWSLILLSLFLVVPLGRGRKCTTVNRPNC